jgi:hypothetical protein
LVAAGAAVAAAVGSTAGQVIGLVLVEFGLVLATSLVFYEVGLSALRHVGDDGYQVTVGGASIMDHGSLDVAVGLLDSQIRIHVGAHASDWTFVPAGVVALGRRALVIPGESFSGKSTLVRALVERGTAYYSDEYAVHRGRARPPVPPALADPHSEGE